MRTLALLLALALTGCCTYKGKAVSRHDADRMREMGMDVHCPGEPRVTEDGQYVQSLFPEVKKCHSWGWGSRWNRKHH